MKGLDWEWLSMDGAMTKAPLGGERTGKNPTDRGKLGAKRSLLTEANGVRVRLTGQVGSEVGSRRDHLVTDPVALRRAHDRVRRGLAARGPRDERGQLAPEFDSLLGDQRVLRIVHGYGTGQLKRAITGFLQQHPLVAHVSQAPPNQGGGGVTVAELKE